MAASHVTAAATSSRRRPLTEDGGAATPSGAVSAAAVRRDAAETRPPHRAGGDPATCVVDMQRSSVADYSAVVALAEVADRYAKVEKAFKIVNLSEEDAKLIRTSGKAVAAAAAAIDDGEGSVRELEKAISSEQLLPLVAGADVEAGDIGLVEQ